MRIALRDVCLYTRCAIAEDKQRFEAQLEGFPKLQGMIQAYQQKQDELKAIKASRKSSSKSNKKRKRVQQETAESDAEVWLSLSL